MSKHTPGDWIVSGDSIVTSDETICIATIETDGGYEATRDEREANSRLIAAAPELLEALKAVIKDVCVPQSDHPWAIQQREAHELARKAIAKAEGQP